MKILPTATRLSFLALLLFVSGCATSSARAADSIYVVVENRKAEMVTIHAVRHSSRFRIGMVQGLQTKQFVIKPHMVGAGGELRLAIDPLGDPQRSYTRSILVNPGDTVRLQLTM